MLNKLGLQHNPDTSIVCEKKPIVVRQVNRAEKQNTGKTREKNSQLYIVVKTVDFGQINE